MYRASIVRIAQYRFAARAALIDGWMDGWLEQLQPFMLIRRRLQRRNPCAIPLPIFGGLSRNQDSTNSRTNRDLVYSIDP